MSTTKHRVSIVTGASRGAGMGIAIALGSFGDTVYITGRSVKDGDSSLPGTIYATADAVNEAGGKAIPLVCDHADDKNVEEVFKQIQKDHGRLDILVNNATHLPEGLTEPAPFWKKSLNQVDILNVGLRSHYVSSYFAAPLLIANGKGLVVNTSSYGGRIYAHGPAYGAGKAGADKMAHDMAIDFQPFNVAVISLWLGLLQTERTKRAMAADSDQYTAMKDAMETPEFSGLVIDALSKDPEIMTKTGQVFLGAELAQSYGILDINGNAPPSQREHFGDTTTFGEAVIY
ncbi:SDR family NAD(P)-dependent oxidoreductase [Parahaliea sp. F7430]|uniref:SDR family NAD(P)-dependent oxidoreductase n=1 Tax=Sediminihaliea albiluteola TaxID=2758564 RepID=A0A7W2YKJ4_9GAMM|nr:SDR family NAD(P)-dependent oxidoreductase [Sediminihaliea albiluteola]MBA6413779.1 SDR family NAD(P)-dependent oxidoreductase [Sediminihaliea albiluteola]